MDLLRTGITKKENIKQHSKQGAAVAPIRRVTPNIGIIFDDGVYQIHKSIDNGKDSYTIMYKNEPFWYNRTTLADAQGDVRRLHKYYKGIDVIHDHEAGILEGIKSGKWHGSPGSIHTYGDIDTLVKSNTDIQGYDIDPEIRGAVYALNHVGLKTQGSCSGHDKKVPGFVSFIGDNKNFTDAEKNTISNIFRQEGLEIVAFENPHWQTIEGEKEKGWSSFRSVTFKPVGI